MAHTQSNTIGLRAYVGTFVTLLTLATLSLLLSELRGTVALTVALGIAAIKALLVLLYFMHLRDERFSFRFVLVVSTVLCCLLIGLTALDPVTRAHPEGPSHNPRFEQASRLASEP